MMKMMRPINAMLLIFLLFLGGCATHQQKNLPIADVNKAFQREYDRILEEEGTRVFKATREQALSAMKKALAELSFGIHGQDALAGYLYAQAPAPGPLTDEEWRRSEEIDRSHLLGASGRQTGRPQRAPMLETEGLTVVVSVLAIDIIAGVEVSATMRLQDAVPQRAGQRLEYMPPTAVRLGLEKIWRAFEQRLKDDTSG